MRAELGGFAQRNVARSPSVRRDRQQAPAQSTGRGKPDVSESNIACAGHGSSGEERKAAAADSGCMRRKEEGLSETRKTEVLLVPVFISETRKTEVLLVPVFIFLHLIL